MKQKKIEQRGLLAGIMVNLLMSIAGMAVFYLTQIEALFVDAYFTIITLLSGIVSFFISKFSEKTSQRFPQGFFVLEPLYSLFQAALTLTLLASSLLSVTQKALVYFTTGQGTVMQVGPVIPYEIVMVSLSWGLSWYYSKQNRLINHTSTMLSAESKSTLIDGIMSAGIGVVACVLLFIKEHSSLGFLLYTGDFFVTLTLILLTVRIPLHIMKNCFIEISGGTLTNKNLQQTINACVQTHLLPNFPIKQCLIYKTGMSLRVHVQLSSQLHTINNESLQHQKKLILKELSAHFAFIKLEICVA
ncbi:cation transporter [Liquorilactobacillus satsumensis]|uniref:cation transporter n=1 Tax=Liquorilactobacillus satsumensis TaxID=259059 RepID=UPI0021C49E37|nr:cation transporter [Liquorilactobacillus satsumensis]MCP9312755.1 cation transporter [Liquorilactobacillus satsumensis]MCP9359231.1 cation transporter [Liquorilactobacillus satsumensis]